MSLGLPVFDLSYEQVNQLTNGYLTIDGTYAFEFFFDPITNFESKRLVKAIFYDGNWSREFDPITNDFLFTDIDSIAFPYIHEIELYLSHQNLQPIGHIHEYQEEENYPEVPFIFESIKKVELSDREQLLSIVKDYEYLFFQTYKFNHNNLTPENNTISDSNYYYKDSITHESGLNEHSIVWALSIEDAKENEISDLVIDMEGNVFKGHFVDFWRDGYGVTIKDNPDWNETEYQNDSIGIEKLYSENHEYLIGSTAIPGMERGATMRDFNLYWFKLFHQNLTVMRFIISKEKFCHPVTLLLLRLDLSCLRLFVSNSRLELSVVYRIQKNSLQLTIIWLLIKLTTSDPMRLTKVENPGDL